jgi:hypothetical protein
MFRGLAHIPVIAAVVTLTGTSYCQVANQGGAYVYWQPISSAPGYDTYEWTITVAELPNQQSFYYWALQDIFTGAVKFSCN